ncbi:MAG: DUF2383 domain-containing protein [Gemmataceae bacterium]
MSSTMTQANPWLNRLLRGELSAVETYQQAARSMNGSADAVQLRNMLQDHIEAVRSLRDHILEHGGMPSDTSGVWGSWASLIEGTASLFGRNAALRALRAGEEHGVNEYERALDDDELPFECKELIRNSLLPLTQAHCGILDGMMMSA